MDGAPPVARVVVFSAVGCHLCGPVIEVAGRVAAAAGTTMAVVDITDDPTLEARYRERIPVVEVDGRPVAKYYVDESALAERLRGTRTK